MHIFSSNPKPCSTLSKLSQNSNLSSLHLSLPGPYTLTNTHLSFPIFTFTHMILDDTHLDSKTNSHNSFFIIKPTPSFALTLSFTPDINPLLPPNYTHPLPFNFVSHTAKISIPSSLNITPISSLFSSLLHPLTFIQHTFKMSPTLITRSPGPFTGRPPWHGGAPPPTPLITLRSPNPLISLRTPPKSSILQSLPPPTKYNSE